MPIILMPFPPIPEETARAAGMLFGKGNHYLRLGEGINATLNRLSAAPAEAGRQRLSASHSLYALTTVFQYTEELTDQQVADAIRRRVEMKYALHLPLYSPDLAPDALCQFRRELRHEPDAQTVFQALLDELQENSLLQFGQPQSIRAVDVLEEICTSKRLELVVTTMLRALAAVAICDTEWLRKVTRPHWFQRYSQRNLGNFWPGTGNERDDKALKIGADIQFLLTQVSQSDRQELTNLGEIQALRQVWQEQYVTGEEGGPDAGRITWQPAFCAECRKKEASSRD